jgi:tetratricopeptide (TPR) repeat protein
MRTFFLIVVLFTLSDSLAAQATIPPGPAVLENARDLLNRGHPDQAVAILKKLAAVEPPIMGVEHELGKALYSTGELAEARNAFAKAIEQDASDQDSVEMEGLVLYRLGQPDAAIPYLERAVKGTQNASADAQTGLGLCLVSVKRYDDARITYARLFGEPPESGGAYLLFATILRRMDLSEPAAIQAQKALDISPGLPLAHFILGEIALAKSDLEGAAGQFEAERRINPDYAPTYDRLGDAYLRMEKLTEAQMALTKAITLDPTLSGAFLKMGMVLLRRKDVPTAITYLRHAAQLDPDNLKAHLFLAQAYHRLGDDDAAKLEDAIVNQIHHDREVHLEPGK